MSSLQDMTYAMMSRHYLAPTDLPLMHAIPKCRLSALHLNRVEPGLQAALTSGILHCSTFAPVIDLIQAMAL